MRRLDGLCVLPLGDFGALQFEDVDRIVQDLGARCEHDPGYLGEQGCDVLLVGRGVLAEEAAQIKANEVMDEAAFLKVVGLAEWSLDVRLERLRGVLAGEPSAQRWEEMCAVFDGWPWEGHGLDVAVEYAMAHLRRWPEALRVLPERWARLDDWGQIDPRLDLVCVSNPKQGVGYLAAMTRPDFFEPFEKVHTLGKLKQEDAHQRRLSLENRRVSVVDAQGDVLVRAVETIEATTVGFSSCERYVWALESRQGQSLIRLLDAQTLEVVEQRGLEHDSAPHYWEDFGFEPIAVSPDGRMIAVYSSIGDSIGATCVFWLREGQIELVPLEVTDREPGEVIGFAPDGSRVLFMSCYNVLSVFSLPDGRRLWSGGALDHDDGVDRYVLFFTYGFGAGNNSAFGNDVMLVLVSDERDDLWGISVHDVRSGEALASIDGCLLGSGIVSEILSERFCRCKNGSVLRYLPALRLRQPPPGPDGLV